MQEIDPNEQLTTVHVFPVSFATQAITTDIHGLLVALLTLVVAFVEVKVIKEFNLIGDLTTMGQTHHVQFFVTTKVGRTLCRNEFASGFVNPYLDGFKRCFIVTTVFHQVSARDVTQILGLFFHMACTKKNLLRWG